MSNMELDTSFALVISTCENYSDLWEANLLLLRRSWSDCPARILLVTDAPTDRHFENVEIISAGEGTEITDRLKHALKSVEERYILFTLDDYFLTYPIRTERILQGLRFMEKHDVAYTRLYPATKHYLRREGAQPCADFEGYYFRNMEEGDYKISLAPGLWRTDFMRRTVNKSLNAWQYEVALTPMARELGARCAISNHNEFPYLDVIRKGKVLRKADRYFKSNPIYSSQRPVMKRRDEWKLGIRTWLRHTLPKGVFKCVKKTMVKHGHQYYSSVQD